MKRIHVFILFILGIILFSLFLFGDEFDKWFVSEEGLEWLRGKGAFAGLIGAGLIVADLFLPIPSPGVMAGLGQIYGWFVGGLYAALGSTVAGLCAYFIVRLMGERAAGFMAGSEELKKLRHFFEHSGAWAIALTRMLPVVPEVLCCLAGLSRMPLLTFFVALVSGTLPVSFVFAGLGSFGEEEPVTTMFLATALPFLIFPPIWFLLQRRAARAKQQ